MSPFSSKPPRNAPREPPVVPARVAALKADYRQAWLYFFLIISLTVAWAVPIRIFWMRRNTFRAEDRGPRDAQTFLAIAFEGVSDSPREISPERFRQHLDGLTRAGYVPITLEEVHAFYAEGAPLPRRAVLLTFDHSRKSSYFDVRTPLRRAGWNAVMFLWTQPILDEDPSALRWPYVRDMIRSGFWEAGAQSHLGFSQIPADSHGTRQNFMTTPQWLDAESRFESPDQFHDRLLADHEFTVRTITRHARTAPRAFAFPFGDFGQFDERAQLTRRINMDLVSQFYDLGFIHGLIGLNTRYSDPRRLNRLLVRPEWTPEEFLRRVELSWPNPDGFTSPGILREPLAWIPEWGQAGLQEQTLTLRATPESTGAKTWLNGTALYGDFHGSFRIRLPAGQLGLFLRASPDGESYLYLGLGDSGDAYLRQKHPGLDPFTLGTGTFSPDANGLLHLELLLRGRSLLATLNGRPLFSELIDIRGTPTPGMIGFSIWHPEPGRAAADLLHLHLDLFRPGLVTWPPTPAADPLAAQWLNQHAFRFSHLSPPWLRIGTRGRAEQSGWNPSQFRDFRDIFRLHFTPEITVESLEIFEPALPAQLFTLARDFGADGLYVNFSEVRGAPPLARITAWIQSLSTAAAEHQSQLLVRLPASFEQVNALQSLAQTLPNLQIVLSESSTIHPAPRDLRTVRAETAAFPPPSFPLFFQLSGGDAPPATDAETNPLHARHLRQDGLQAFRNHQSDQAITLFESWARIDPLNEEPWALIGDVQAHRRNFAAATEAYRRSLHLNPGQTRIVSALARMLDTQMDRRPEAIALLNTYTTLFPDNSELALLRAEIDLRAGDHAAARRRIDDVIARNPDDLRAHGLLHALLPGPAERIQNLNRIAAIATRPGMSAHFIEAVHTHHLMRWPESWRLYPLLQTLQAREAAPSQRLIQQLLPRETLSVDPLPGGSPGPEWEIFGADPFANPESPPLTTETALRLRRSDSLRNGFVEALLENPHGTFWLYARRSEAGMIRFGFDPTGRIFLQIWRNGQLLSNQNRLWARPQTPVRLRLEIRGDAAYAFLDGQPAFGAPTRIPAAFGFGWWGAGPWTPQFGTAQVTLREIAGGPAPLHLALFRPRVGAIDDEELLNALRHRVHRTATASPPWFRQETDGSLVPEHPTDAADFRTLTRFHQIRLLPAVRAASPHFLRLDTLADTAREHRVDGFLFLVNRLPDDDWFLKAETAILDTPLTLLFARVDEENRTVHLREVTGRAGLFPGPRIPHAIPLWIKAEDPPLQTTLPAPLPPGTHTPDPHQFLLF